MKVGYNKITKFLVKVISLFKGAVFVFVIYIDIFFLMVLVIDCGLSELVSGLIFSVIAAAESTIPVTVRPGKRGRTPEP